MEPPPRSYDHDIHALDLAQSSETTGDLSGRPLALHPRCPDHQTARSGSAGRGR